ncbi:MAG: DUF2878 domain-containing protein [Nitrospirota bacterium]|jgi:hypothetical protein
MSGRRALRVLANVLAFQAGWFACVLGGAYQRPWLGTAAAAVIVAAHLAGAGARAREATLVGLVALIGFAWDSALVAVGWFHYASGTIVDGGAPAWILALWALFATTLNVSLRWLRGRPLLAAALGAVGGPLAFYTGARLGAVTLSDPAIALCAQGAGWAALLPILSILAQRLDGIDPPLDERQRPCLISRPTF